MWVWNKSTFKRHAEKSSITTVLYKLGYTTLLYKPSYIVIKYLGISYKSVFIKFVEKNCIANWLKRYLESNWLLIFCFLITLRKTGKFSALEVVTLNFNHFRFYYLYLELIHINKVKLRRFILLCRNVK